MSSGQEGGPRSEGAALVALMAAAVTAALAAVAAALTAAAGPRLPGATVLLLAATLMMSLVAVGAAVAVRARQARRQRSPRPPAGGNGTSEDPGELLKERNQLRSQLSFWGGRDALTQVANRAGGTAALSRWLATGQGCSLVVVGCSGLRTINAVHGTATGDAVLQAMAQRVVNCLRQGDMVVRTAGNEFAVLAPGLSPKDTLELAGRLARSVRASYALGGRVLDIGVRVAVVHGEGAVRDPEEMLRRAEVALATATVGGPVVPFTLADERQAAERARLTTDLALGLREGQVWLAYQPLVCTRTGLVASVESLARWQHPDRGAIPPDTFIPLAERSGLVAPLGLAVLEASCRQLRAWHADPRHSHLSVAVNLSARQLEEPSLLEDVQAILWRSGVDPRRVILELTESLLEQDSTAMTQTLWQLRGLGVRLALDDFGTGYSSLSRLDALPIDEIKLDRSFVSRLGAPEHDSTTVVSAAIAMGRGLGLTVVAEGVETSEQARILTDLGCDLLQGYLLGRPGPPEGLTALLGRRLLPDSPAATVPPPRAPLTDASRSVAPAVLPGLARDGAAAHTRLVR